MYTIYTKEGCDYCDMAKAELRRLKMNYQEVLVTPGSPSMDEVLKRCNKTVVNLTFPQVFNSEGNESKRY
jgi:glutaredoxin